MRKLYIVIALFICQVGLHAQDRYFLYLQTDNEQAFYARIQGRTLSSSASGYLILPRVSDSTLTITIGFPKRLFPEQTFFIRNITSDKGFLLKNAPEKGWVLADMQSSEMLLASSADGPRASDVPARSSSPDPFSELLSTVINDSSLSETPIVRSNKPAAAPLMEQEVKPRTGADTTARRVTISEPATSDSNSLAPNLSRTDGDAPRKKGSRKILEQIDATGVQIVFSDELPSGNTDTISVWIPKDKIARPNLTAGSENRSAASTDSSQSSFRQFPDRSDCKAFVNTRDLGLLRRRMEALTDEDAKVSLALRSFREACFSTEQVRNLLMVFGREEGRFKLLDAAYPYVLDPSKFTELESVLKDSYFIYRFRKKTSAPPQR